MMASNILSRLLPSTSDDEDRIPPPPSDKSDIEALPHDLESEPRYEDQDLEELLREDMMDDMPIPKRPDSVSDRGTRGDISGTNNPAGPSSKPHPSDPDMSDDDDDVPESLLLEGRSERRRKRKSRNSRPAEEPTMPVPGPSTRTTRLQWETARAHQQLHSEIPRPHPVHQTTPQRGIQRGLVIEPKQRAMWMWANVESLDQFLIFVYYYYEQHGIYSILLNRLISLLTAIFVWVLSTFLFFCIDYSKLPGSSKLSDVQVDQCTKKLPTSWNLFSYAFVLIGIFVTCRFLQEVPKLWDMHNFYDHLLGIPDKDIQTVSWQYVIAKLMELRDANPHTASNISSANRRFIHTQSKQRMDAHDINNRLMRRENYWISLINKDLLNCSLNMPFVGRRSFYTRSLELMISICLMDFVFDENGQVKQEFRTTRRRQKNIEILQKRFRTAGLLNIFLSLPIAIWALAMRFLTSFTEYQKNPSELSTRKFSLLAEWKMRDLNEVSHHFHRRKRVAAKFANRYLDQFPKDKLNQAFRFAAFIPGALAAVLGVITMWDPDLFLGFEISGRTALFWVGVLGTLFVTFRNAASDEEDDLWDPEIAMKAVIANTHYCPDSWQGRLYSDEVRRDFAGMYKLEAVLFLEDIAAVIITPLLLMWSLPSCADTLIDFFREFTIDIDGLGTVCSFAVFDFKSGGKAPTRPGQSGPDDLREDYYGDKANKLMASYMSFLEHYGPNPTKRGMHSRKRLFHPPPTFPGITASPHGFAEATASVQRHGPSILRQSIQQTPRLAPSGSHISPIHSILLDPHHQPRASPRQGPTRGALRAGAASSRAHVLEDDPLEAEEEEGDDGASPSRAMPRTTSNLVIEDSELGDSWLKGGDPIEDEVGRDGDASAEATVGVLGMLMEFKDAQTERRGGHI